MGQYMMNEMRIITLWQRKTGNSIQGTVLYSNVTVRNKYSMVDKPGIPYLLDLKVQ